MTRHYIAHLLKRNGRNEMNSYELKGTCMFSGSKCTHLINAESEEKAISIASDRGLSMKTIELKSGDVIIAEPAKTEEKIVDAEELLYEMDMSGTNEITVSEFTGSRLITRKQVIAALHDDSIRK